VLTSLQIKNFKAWRDTGRVELAPLTLLFGTNSSGKSSLHQFLLMLRQTAESPDRRRVLHTGDSTTPVDLGGYSDLVTHRDVKRGLEFALEWSRPSALQIQDLKTGARIQGTSLRFDARIGAAGSSPPKPQVESYEYRLTGADGTQLRLGSHRDEAGNYQVTAEGVSPVRTLGRKWPISPPSHFHGFPDDLRTRFQNLDFAADLTLALDEQLNALSYLGPLREKPGRLYRWSGEEPGHVGWRGERTVEALLSGSGRRFNAAPKRKLRPLEEVVAAWLKQLGLIDSFSVNAIGAGRDEYEVRVRALGGIQRVLLPDVGFGVSQVLPVIVECFYSQPNSTVIMEQPEIHLHPAAQANLADLFIEAISMRENGYPRKVQLIVESHSEHLLRRLLRRVAEGTLDPELVRCYVVSSPRMGSRIEPLEVDGLGNVHNWPADFFGDPTADIVAQSRSARERRRAAAE